MNVNTLDLRNFSNHAATSLSLPRCSLFAAPVGCGKSSVLDALAMLFCGRTRLCDGKGSGSVDYIQHGAESFTITAEVMIDGNGLLLERTRSETKNSLSGFPAEKSGVEAQQQALLKALNTRQDLLLAVLDSKPLLARTEKEQRAEVLAVVQPGVASLPLSPERQKQLQKLLRVSGIATLEECARLYESAYKLRTKANQERDTLSRNLPVRPEAVMQEFGLQPGETLPAHWEVERDIHDYRQQVKALEAKRTQANAVTETLARLRATPEAAPEPPPTLAGPLPPAYESEEVMMPEARRFEKQEELGATRGAYDAIGGETEGIQERRALKTAELNAARTAQTAIATQAIGAKCPCCQRRITEKARNEALASLEATIAEAEGAVWKIDADLIPLFERLKAKRADLDRLNGETVAIEAFNVAIIENAEKLAHEAAERNKDRKAGYDRALRQTAEANEKAQAQYDRAVKAAEERKAQIEALETQAREAQATLPEIQAQIAEHEERIQKAEQALKAVTRIESATLLWNKAHGEYQAAEAKATELDELVSWLGPKGLPAELFSEWSKPFIAKMQSVLDRFGYGALLVEAEADQPFQFLLKRESGTVPASHLSTGQATVLEWSYRSAMAELSGIGFVALDAASNLGDGEALATLCAAIRQSSHQVIVTLTTEDPVRAASLAREMGARLFWLSERNGSSVVEQIGDREPAIAAD